MKNYIIKKVSDLLFKTRFIEFCQNLLTFVQCNMGYIAAMFAFYVQ